MSDIKVCQNCGCSEIVSDRSLGGRMVCFRCGSSSFRNKSFSPIKSKKMIYIAIGIVILFIIII